MTAFMAVIAAAVDLAALNPAVVEQLIGITHIAPWPMFFWLTSAGGIMAQPQGRQRNNPLSKDTQRPRTGGPTNGTWLRSVACTRPKVSGSTRAGCSPSWISSLYRTLPA